ncbi:MAG: response regulator transcription factor [Candidatus Nanopelagicales bacterium]
MITVAVVEDHAMVREGLVRTLEAQSDIHVGYSGDSPAAVRELRPGPRIVLLDLDLNGSPADPADAAALAARPDCDVIVVSALSDPEPARVMLDVGVATICPKHEPVESLLAAIRAVAAGESWTSALVAQLLLSDQRADRPELSGQELRVLRAYAAGMPLAAVAAQMYITPDTAAQYVKRIRRKYDEVGRDTHTKSSLYRAAVADGYLDLDEGQPGV